ncbi:MULTISPECIES: ATPase domain-containing protein [unclassified Massilia]|uniref:ATPase domain-containing protein n=1 Tax=unclassified Massilia TaxID=2609279 RepID=UPI0017874E35|nr:AAA family ATPase [Massilia sp. CFBP 13647]MBD8675594.1 AAA family ATPase [Massilia sp. CFBP 13721]
MSDIEKIHTGIPELDLVLRGGLPRSRVHLVEGRPGSGKTTLGLRFLIDGRDKGEACCYISLSETVAELRATAASHGWSLEGIEMREVVPAEVSLERQQSVLFPSEAELGETIALITDIIDECRPMRVVIDSMSELRMVANDPMRYRRQIVVLKQFLLKQACTTMLMDDLTDDPRQYDLQGTVHGVITLEQREREFGAARRRLRVVKMRGADFQSGWHDFAITGKEVYVFPSLIADEHAKQAARGVIESRVPSLDQMLGGGLARGTSVMILGPTGAGKSSLALQYANVAAEQDEHVAYFAFDETKETLLDRANGLSIRASDAIGDGRIFWERINPSRISPGEFIWKVRRQVEDHDAAVVVIDSVNSYLETMHEETSLLLQMHELLSYLSNRGVLTILIVGQSGLLDNVHDPLDVGFLSDTVVLLRFFESGGDIRKAISVLKKRPGRHETMIREFSLNAGGVCVGERIDGMQGVLTGEPRAADEPASGKVPADD